MKTTTPDKPFGAICYIGPNKVVQASLFPSISAAEGAFWDWYDIHGETCLVVRATGKDAAILRAKSYYASKGIKFSTHDKETENDSTQI